MKTFLSVTMLLILTVIFTAADFENSSYFDNLNKIKNELNAEYIYTMAPKVQQQFEVNPGEKLVVHIETGADIIVEGWNKNFVDIDINFTGRDADEVDLQVERTSYGVLVKAEYEGKRKNRNTSGMVNVKVPNRFDIDLETMGGELKVSSIEGNLKGTTMGGELSLTKLKGEVDFSTMGGAVSLTDSDVDGKVSTMGGEVIVENVVGDVDASSMGGKVIQRNVKSKSGDPDSNEMKVKTTGGDIDLDEAMNGANVKTMGGDITVNNAAKFIVAETMGGNIKVKKLDGWIKANTMGGNVDVKIVGSSGKKDIDLSSMGGNIEVYVPSELSMDIKIEIIYDEDDEEDIDIISDFDLVERVDKHRNDKMRLTATGITGDGSNEVKIKTIGGKVYLKKS